MNTGMGIVPICLGKDLFLFLKEKVTCLICIVYLFVFRIIVIQTSLLKTEPTFLFFSVFTVFCFSQTFHFKDFQRVLYFR